MELPGSAYLYTLATLAMTFAGFCAIVVVLRQTTGQHISGFHLILTRLYLEASLFSAAFCMLPSLLAICGLTEPMVWRVSSAIIAVVLFCFGATYNASRGAALTAGPVPRARWMRVVSVSTLVVITLVSNAAGFPYRPTIGPIAVAATWTLGCGAAVFVLALSAVWTNTVEGSQDEPTHGDRQAARREGTEADREGGRGGEQPDEKHRRMAFAMLSKRGVLREASRSQPHVSNFSSS